MQKPASLTLLAVALAALGAGQAQAQVVLTPSTPQIGSSNPVTAEPLVPRPTTKPCVVQLYNNIAFDDFNTKPFTYTPPSDCRGPWAKVVFTADFTYTGGGYDRTASVFIGNATVFYGTTPESNSWHVERDVTDLSAIFANSQTSATSYAYLGNSTGIIYGNAALEFYPADFRNPAPRTPDLVIPAGQGVGLWDGTTTYTQTLNLPQNVTEIYADVISQNQSTDEAFYLELPNDVAGDAIYGGGNGSFRETEISLDGNPAGLAPAYPWIFTGGLNPYNWVPITANQTLDLKPYRVNLTPFAATLDDGQPHTIVFSEYNSNDYFLLAANLLVYLDHGRKKVTGELVENTLTAPVAPTEVDGITSDASTGAMTGPVTVSTSRSFKIRGFVDTSEGRVETAIDETASFTNTNTLNYNLNTYFPLDQQAQQQTTVDSVTSTDHGGLVKVSKEHLSYPLFVDLSYNGGYIDAPTVDQQYIRNTTESWTTRNGWPLGKPYTTSISEETKSTASWNFNTGALSGNSSQNYTATDSEGACYNETLTSANFVLTGVTNNCHAHK